MEVEMNSFQTFLLGFIILILGLAAAAYLLGVPAVWIAIGVIILIGIGIMSSTDRTKPRDGTGPRY
jgi:Na+/proline symporter